MNLVSLSCLFSLLPHSRIKRCLGHLCDGLFWGFDGALHAPPISPNASPENPFVESQFSLPFKYGHSPSLVGDQPISGRIPLLGSLRSPSNIIGRVWAIVVNTIKRCTGWSSTDNGEKFRECGEGRVNLYSSSPIVSVLYSFRVIASGSHVLKCHVLDGLRKPVIYFHVPMIQLLPGASLLFNRGAY